MKLFVLVHQEHYEKYCEKEGLKDSAKTFQAYLKDIGTPSITFQSKSEQIESNYLSYKEVPDGSCIRFRLHAEYVAIIHQKLFQESHERPDKSRRGSSCCIV